MELFRNACAFTLTMRKWSNRRKGDISKVIVDADKARLKISKTLIESPELDTIKEFTSGLYKWCCERCNPSCFKDGIYLVKISEVPKFEDRLNKGQAQLMNDLVPAFLEAYPKQIEASRAILNEQFDSEDYPSIEKMRETFGISWNWIAFGVPDNIPAELREAESKKIEAQFKEAEVEIMAALREGFSKVVAHVSERLTEVPGEKKKIFRDSLFEDLSSFIENFSARNLVNDTALESLVNQAKGILTQVRGDNPKEQAQVVRDSEEMRAKTAEAFAAMRVAVDATIMDKPGRKFQLDME